MQVETGAHSACPARNLPARTNRNGAVAATYIEELPLDYRGDSLHQAGLAGSTEDLPGEEARPVDPEEHPAHSSGAHRFHVDPVRQHSYAAPAHQ
jgi:hypothetical protein